MAIEQDIVNLQKQINELKGKTDSPFTTAVTNNPFSKLGELKEQQGSTGSAKYRNLPLFMLRNGIIAFNSNGNHKLIGYHTISNTGQVTLSYGNSIIPDDVVNGGITSINIMYSAPTGGDDFDISIVMVAAKRKEQTDNIVLLTEVAYTTYLVNAVADTIDIISVDLTLPPQKGDVIAMSFARNGDTDDNNGLMDIWGVWLKYLAYS